MESLRIEKMINKESKEVFKSLQEGKLFMNCSADSNTIQLDFRTGGKYKVDFKTHQASNWGEFLEIIPNQKIVFTWCQTFGLDQKPDTTVTIELFPEGNKTKLVLVHSGFKDQASHDNHKDGWTGGINDFTNEMEHNRIRLLRRFATTVEELYKTVKQRGEFVEVIPNQKMTLSLNGTTTTLVFNKRDDTFSTLEIVQEGVSGPEEHKSYRQKWDVLTSQLLEVF